MSNSSSQPSVLRFSDSVVMVNILYLVSCYILPYTLYTIQCQCISLIISPKFFFIYTDPLWASVNLVVCVCERCIGVHRKLGVHTSKPRSLLMDEKIWQPSLIKVCQYLRKKIFSMFPQSYRNTNGSLSTAFLNSPKLSQVLNN